MLRLSARNDAEEEDLNGMHLRGDRDRFAYRADFEDRVVTVTHLFVSLLRRMTRLDTPEDSWALVAQRPPHSTDSYSRPFVLTVHLFQTVIIMFLDSYTYHHA